MGSLRVGSYNLHGVNNGSVMLNELLLSVDILAVQEHWLRENEFAKLLCINDDFEGAAVSAMDNSVIHFGRPFGGVAFLWRKDCFCEMRSVCMNGNSRCMAVSFWHEGGVMCVFNVYLPCKGMYNDDENDLQLVQCMSFIEDTVVNIVDNRVCDVTVIVVGDFNANIDTIAHDVKLAPLRLLLDDMGLVACDDLDESGVGYTFRCEGLGCTSYIDHCFISKGNKSLVRSVNIVDSSSNLSDHNPIVVVLDVCWRNIMGGSDDGDVYGRNVTKRVVWDEAFCAEYCSVTEQALLSLNELELNCNAGGCCNSGHKCVIESWCKQFSDILLKCMNDVNSRRSDHIKRFTMKFAWNEELGTVKRRLIDICSLWKKVGRPRNGGINDERLRVKGQYKRLIREQKLAFESGVKQRMVYKLANRDSKGFWKGWRSMQKSGYVKPKQCISGVQGNNEVCNGFKSYFMDNFVDSWNDNVHCERLLLSMHELESEFAECECIIFSVEDVLRALNNVAGGKACGLDDLPAEALKFCGKGSIRLLSNLFSLCVKHAFVPSNFCVGRITPVPKKVGVCGKFEDFRPVSTVNIIGKIFEYCLLNKLEPLYKFHELQFGFTPGGGCINASHVLRSVVEYFNEYGSLVYVAALDISKAYDRLNQCLVILKLRKLCVNVDIILMFCYWFQHLCAVVSWEGVVSSDFYVRSGVRQGGVCSPWLFNVYIDELITVLEESGNGCYMRGVFAGCIMYADDVLLVSASVVKLQKMLDLCFEFANDNGLKFNSVKSGCLVFGKGFDNCKLADMTIGNECINWVPSYMYLGLKIVSGRQFSVDVDGRRSKFCAAVNSVLSHKTSLSEECIMHIIKTQCLPVLGYGAGVWKCNNETIRRVGVCFNDAIRRIFGYRRYESVRNIVFEFGMLPVDLYVAKSRLLMVSNAMISERELVRVCADYVVNSYEFYMSLTKFGVNVLTKHEIDYAVWVVSQDLLHD